MRGRLEAWKGTRQGGAKGDRFGRQDATAFCDTYEMLNLGGFWSTDATGCVTYLSEAIAEKLSVEGGLTGKMFLDLFRGDEGREGGGLPMALARRSQFHRVMVQTGQDRKSVV